MARVFSGTLKRGSKVYVLGPKHDAEAVLEMVSAMQTCCAPIVSVFLKAYGPIIVLH